MSRAEALPFPEPAFEKRPPLSQAGATAGSDRAFPELAVVAPTYNERGNIGELVGRLAEGLRGLRWEAIIVDDDSPDGTAAFARDMARNDARVRVIRRVGRRGLSSACIEGMLSSNADFIAVIDADLQHDPALLALMLKAIRDDEADIVVASRYVQGGDVGVWSTGRSRLSRWATSLTRRVSGVPVHDPMSGYFLLRRSVIDERAHRLSGRGFKILLDILMTDGHALKVVELPFTFGQRRIGVSKISPGVLWQGLTLLAGKTLANHLPARFLSFAGVGASGVVVQFVALSLILTWTPTSFGAAQVVATLIAMTTNFALNNRMTFAGARRGMVAWLAGLIRFAAVCGLGVCINVLIAQALLDRGLDWRIAALIGIATAAVWNFVAASTLVWSGAKPPRP